PAAVGRDRTVVTGDADVVDRDAERLGDDLCHGGQRALTLVGQTGQAAHRARRLEPQRAAVLGRNRRTGGAVIGRAVGGLLRERAQARAATDAAPAELARLP